MGGMRRGVWAGLMGGLAAAAAGLCAGAAGGDKAGGVRIEVRDAAGAVVAEVSAGGGPAALNVEREYKPGDRIIVTGPPQMVVRLDAAMPECPVFSPTGRMELPVTHRLGRADGGGGLGPRREMIALLALQRRFGICAAGLPTHRAGICDFGPVARSSRGGSGDPPR